MEILCYYKDISNFFSMVWLLKSENWFCYVILYAETSVIFLNNWWTLVHNYFVSPPVGLEKDLEIWVEIEVESFAKSEADRCITRSQKIKLASCLYFNYVEYPLCVRGTALDS